jgi:hypothetical protein
MMQFFRLLNSLLQTKNERLHSYLNKKIRWFTPVILAIWESEMRMIMVRSQSPGQIVHETLSREKKKGFADAQVVERQPSKCEALS